MKQIKIISLLLSIWFFIPLDLFAIIDISDEQLEELNNKQVELVKIDGQVIEGKLISYNEQVVVILDLNMEVVSCNRTNIMTIKSMNSIENIPGADSNSAVTNQNLNDSETDKDENEIIDDSENQTTDTDKQNGLSEIEYDKLVTKILRTPNNLMDYFIKQQDGLLNLLSPEQQYSMLEIVKTPTEVKANMLFLNLVMPGLGSLSSGDYISGSITLTSYLSGSIMLLIGSGRFFTSGSADAERLRNIQISGIALLISSYLAGIITPWFFNGRKYYKLKKVFKSKNRIQDSQKQNDDKIALEPNLLFMPDSSLRRLYSHNSIPSIRPVLAFTIRY